MATTLEALKGITAYPIPSRTLDSVAARRGCELSEEATAEVLQGSSFNLAKADLLLWLSLAPNISQGGQNYSFSEEQRMQFRNQANGLLKEFGADDGTAAKPVFGYKGSRL